MVTGPTLVALNFSAVETLEHVALVEGLFARDEASEQPQKRPMGPRNQTYGGVFVDECSPAPAHDTVIIDDRSYAFSIWRK
jgi:hypothetical protein